MVKKAPLAKKPATKWELDKQCLNRPRRGRRRAPLSHRRGGVATATVEKEERRSAAAKRTRRSAPLPPPRRRRSSAALPRRRGGALVRRRVAGASLRRRRRRQQGGATVPCHLSEEAGRCSPGAVANGVERSPAADEEEERRSAAVKAEARRSAAAAPEAEERRSAAVEAEARRSAAAAPEAEGRRSAASARPETLIAAPRVPVKAHMLCLRRRAGDVSKGRSPVGRPVPPHWSPYERHGGSSKTSHTVTGICSNPVSATPSLAAPTAPTAATDGPSLSPQSRSRPAAAAGFSPSVRSRSRPAAAAAPSAPGTAGPSPQPTGPPPPPSGPEPHRPAAVRPGAPTPRPSPRGPRSTNPRHPRGPHRPRRAPARARSPPSTARTPRSGATWTRRSARACPARLPASSCPRPGPPRPWLGQRRCTTCAPGEVHGRHSTFFPCIQLKSQPANPMTRPSIHPPPLPTTHSFRRSLTFFSSARVPVFGARRPSHAPRVV